VDKAAWTGFLVFATALVLVLAAVSIAKARPRRQVLAPFVPSLAASILIYINMVEGADSFHTAFLFCSGAALLIALGLIIAWPERNLLATFSWAMLGVVTPYLAFIALFTIACPGECLK
jgi:multisubunit Na+/H+ antiporter MnhB subunit